MDLTDGTALPQRTSGLGTTRLARPPPDHGSAPGPRTGTAGRSVPGLAPIHGRTPTTRSRHGPSRRATAPRRIDPGGPRVSTCLIDQMGQDPLQELCPTAARELSASQWDRSMNRPAGTPDRALGRYRCGLTSNIRQAAGPRFNQCRSETCPVDPTGFPYLTHPAGVHNVRSAGVALLRTIEFESVCDDRTQRLSHPNAAAGHGQGIRGQGDPGSNFGRSW